MYALGCWQLSVLLKHHNNVKCLKQLHSDYLELALNQTRDSRHHLRVNPPATLFFLSSSFFEGSQIIICPTLSGL